MDNNYYSRTDAELQALFLGLSRAGLNVMPCKDTKHPVLPWKRWQAERIPEKTLRKWFVDKELLRGRWCILTGSLSGVVAPDADDADAVTYVEANLPPTPATDPTSHGKHFLYRHPGEYVRSAPRTQQCRKLDVKGDKGILVLYDVDHWSTWTKELLAGLPVYVNAWLPPPAGKAGNAKSQRDPGEGGGEADVDLDFEETDLEEAVAEARRAGRLPPNAECVRQYRDHLVRSPGAVQGRGADAYCFALARCGLWDYAVPPADAVTCLHEWGRRDDHRDEHGGPYPWTLPQIAWKVRGAHESLEKGASERPLGSRISWDEWLHQAGERASERCQRTDQPQNDKNDKGSQEMYDKYFLDTDGFFDLAAKHKVSHVINNLLIQGGVNIFSGLSFAGKTTILGWILGHVIRGKPLFGDFPTAQQHVLYYNGDANYPNLLARYLDAGFEGKRQAGFHYLQTPPDVLTADLLDLHCNVVWNKAGKDKHLLVVVDTLRSMLFMDAQRGDDLDTIAMTQKLKPFRDLTNRMGGTVTVVFVYHNARTTNEFYGTGAFMNLIDSYWNYLREKESTTATLQIQTREMQTTLTCSYHDGKFGTLATMEIGQACEEAVKWAKTLPGDKSGKASMRNMEKFFGAKNVKREIVRLAHEHLTTYNVITAKNKLADDCDARFTNMKLAFGW